MATETAAAPVGRRWGRSTIAPADAALALGIGAIQILATYAAARHQHVHHAWDPLAVILLGAGPAALVVRRRHPVAVMVVALASAMAYWLIGYGRGPLFLALIVALVSAVVVGHRRAAIVTLITGYLGFLFLRPVLGLSDAHWPTLNAILGVAAWLLVFYAVGESLRVRRVRAIEAAHVRAAEARRTVSEERLRIARELHDVLAHNISLINVQASTTLHRAEHNEERAYEALATIKRVSQETLAELRSLLGALREVDEAAPRAPAPSLDRIEDLVVSAASAGVRVEVGMVGDRRDLPASIDLAAYRIVQEALTNVVRHAGTERAAVRITYEDDAVSVQVDDDGRARVDVVAGTGITGMTERATALGGTLQAGPRPGGGFRVLARLPLEPTQ